MILKSVLAILTITNIGYGFQAFDNLKPSSSSKTQEDAVRQLINRVIPRGNLKFSVEVSTESAPEENKDFFEVQKLETGKIHIRGSTGVAVATGFHYYLKYYCNCHISWQTTNKRLPARLPDVNITITLNDRLRYYQNVCTASYSFVWWGAREWTRHIDWMALNSFNLVLSFNGMEDVWRQVYKRMGLTTKEIDEHFSGPAFLSWNRMGNIRGWGGPLSDAWHNRSIALQNVILKQMRNIGIISVLPAFDGHVPRAFARLFPGAKINTTSTWNRFEDKYCCPLLLDPTDPLFATVGKAFMDEMISRFGTDHAYSCDTFNEMIPSSGDPAYLSKMGQSVYAAMEAVDSKAIWIMQNWLFVHDLPFWTESRAKALLTSVPQGRMIVLDLQSEQFPQYQRLKSYYGQPYIWCMLHNFGATLGMFGSADIINTEIFKARNEPNNTLIGIGLTPEGINQNYVIYDLMSEMAWRSGPTNLTNWFSLYAQRRYGKQDKSIDIAWDIFHATVYNFDDKRKMRGRYALNQRPRKSIYTWIWYNIYDFFAGWSFFLRPADSFWNSTGYRHDLVDITRQFLQILGDEYYKEIIAAFRLQNVRHFQHCAAKFLEILYDMEEILATDKAFLLGVWLSAAKDSATSEEDRKLYEYNARNQITLWGPRGEIVDYASKQWSGMVSDFYIPRWTLYLQTMNESLINNNTFNEPQVISRIFTEIEKPFTFDRSVFTTSPEGNTIHVARRLYIKWWRDVERLHARAHLSLAYPNLIKGPVSFAGEDYENSPIVYTT